MGRRGNIPHKLLEPSAIRAHNGIVGTAIRIAEDSSVRIVLAFISFAWVFPAMAAPPTASDRELIHRLVAALKDPDADVRANLSQALAKIGPTAVEPLTEALADPLPERRAGAAYALGLVGPVAKSALPQLLTLLDDKDTDVRRHASLAIVRVLPSAKPTAKPTGGQLP